MKSAISPTANTVLPLTGVFAMYLALTSNVLPFERSLHSRIISYVPEQSTELKSASASILDLYFAESSFIISPASKLAILPVIVISPVDEIVYLTSSSPSIPRSVSAVDSYLPAWLRIAFTIVSLFI